MDVLSLVISWVWCGLGYDSIRNTVFVSFSLIHWKNVWCSFGNISLISRIDFYFRILFLIQRRLYYESRVLILFIGSHYPTCLGFLFNGTSLLFPF